jgi:hypothetical protein
MLLLLHVEKTEVIKFLEERDNTFKELNLSI